LVGISRANYIVGSDTTTTSPGISRIPLPSLPLVSDATHAVFPTVGPFPVPSFWPKEPLAYIEWHSELKLQPNSQSHLFCLVQCLETQPGTVLPLSEIRQACLLAPDFSDLPLSDTSLDTHRILDKCNNFYINNFTSKLCYSTLW
jgi:hypothetical protein